MSSWTYFPKWFSGEKEPDPPSDFEKVLATSEKAGNVKRDPDIIDSEEPVEIKFLSESESIIGTKDDGSLTEKTKTLPCDKNTSETKSIAFDVSGSCRAQDEKECSLSQQKNVNRSNSDFVVVQTVCPCQGDGTETKMCFCILSHYICWRMKFDKVKQQIDLHSSKTRYIKLKRREILSECKPLHPLQTYTYLAGQKSIDVNRVRDLKSDFPLPILRKRKPAKQNTQPTVFKKSFAEIVSDSSSLP